MIEDYLDIITNVTNYVDGLLVIDSDFKVVYLSQFRSQFSPLDERRAIGKTLFEIYPTLDPEKSTLVAAVKYGRSTLNHEDTYRPTVGKPFKMRDDTYPILEDGKIIGAVNVAFMETGRESRAVSIKSSRPQKRKKLYTVTDIIGRSPAVQAMRTQIEKVAKTSSAVLVYGETGTGKELVAQSIHSSSNRTGSPFLSQNCAAIPSNLLESLFFGTAKGAYTGAEDRPGLFERANGGTLFLDEINSMEIDLQAKLLRVLEERKVTRIGDNRPYDIDVRIIAATNRDPMECVREGVLRPDLFYRLSGVTINVPTLLQREEDIELLTQYFISQFNQSMGREIIGVSQDVMQVFRDYRWPGNVRELRNAIEGAFNLCEGRILTTDDLPSYLTSSVGFVEEERGAGAAEPAVWLGTLKKNMDAYEKALITDIIHRFESLSAAADYMGITRQALNQKMKKLGIRK